MYSSLRVLRRASRTAISSTPNVRSRSRLIIVVLLVFAIGYIYKVGVHLPGSKPTTATELPKYIRSNRSVKVYPACPIPQLDPYNPFIQHFLQGLPPSVDCESKFPLLFNSTFQSTIVPAKDEDYFEQKGIISCNYRTVTRKMSSKEPDENVITSSKAYPLSLMNATVIPPEHEFIAIYCKRKYHFSTEEKLMDVHAFVPLKPPMNETTNGQHPDSLDGERKRKWNVLIFGMDAFSRMTFLRTMPKTYAFLMDELGTVEMLGYKKVGVNTFPNLIPMMTSKKPSELSCTSNQRSMNECPFIWKDYFKKGYLTAFAEDAPHIAAFNFRHTGFRQQPTDYYLRAMIKMADPKLTSHHQIIAAVCYGPRLTFQVLLDYMEKFVHTMRENKQAFFQFTWATSLTHDRLAAGHLGDPHLLKWMKESGHLDDTILILMSDHGNRMADIRSSVQGSLEDRLPLMYVVLPDAFKKQYKLAYSNLLQNSSKLVTTFDLHETLQDILHPEKIEDSALAGITSSSMPRGISLFRSIPEDRTCAMAGIDDFFCSCNYLNQVHTDEPELKEVVKKAMRRINKILERNDPPCAKLELEQITFAKHARRSEYYWAGYLINFQTMPGGGQFEALVGKNERNSPWRVDGEVVRANVYENQSRCVTDAKLKPYCYCTDLNP